MLFAERTPTVNGRAALKNAVGRLLFKFKNSHFAGCKPYSKSVSINDWGWITRCLLIASNCASAGVVVIAGESKIT